MWGDYPRGVPVLDQMLTATCTFVCSGLHRIVLDSPAITPIIGKQKGQIVAKLQEKK